MIVWVIIHTNGGWDAVAGVYDSLKKAQDYLVEEYRLDRTLVENNDVDEFWISEETVK